MNGLGWKGWAVVSMGMPLTFGLVLASYYLMEKPILEWKKRFTPDGRQNARASHTKESRQCAAAGKRRDPGELPTQA